MMSHWIGRGARRAAGMGRVAAGVPGRGTLHWAVLLLCGGLSVAQARLEVVATLTDLGAVAQAVGGDQVRVTSLGKGSEDPHFVDARPSFIRILNRADVLIEGGAELELGWLPPLVQNARNAKILPGGPGHVKASEGVAMLEIPAGPVDRSQGDIHTLGNPHFMLDPVQAKTVAAHLAAVFARLDPDHASVFEANRQAFADRIDEKLPYWQERLKPFAGTKVLTYHKTFEYFAHRFGLVVAGQLEPKPGLEPSPSYITGLIPSAKEQGVRLVLIESFRPRRTPEYVAKSVGATLVIMPDKVDCLPGTPDYFAVLDRAVEEVAKALGSTR